MASSGSHLAQRLAWSLYPSARRLGASHSLMSLRCQSSVAQPGAGEVAQEDAAATQPMQHFDTASILGHYIALHPRRVPEAFQQLHNAFYLPKQGGKPQHPEGTEPPLPRKGGCKGLQLEMKVAGLMPVNEQQDLEGSQAGLEASSSGGGSKTSEGATAVQGPAVMWRHCMWGLEQHLLRVGSSSSSSSSSSSESSEEPDTGRQRVRMLVEGPSGSGKSIALTTMVERRRAADWLVLYVPSATALTWGGYFVPRSFPCADGTEVTRYDTLISAQHILLGMKQAHGEQLQGLPLRSPQSKQVLQAARGQPTAVPPLPSAPASSPPSSSPASEAAAEGPSTSTEAQGSTSSLGANHNGEESQQQSGISSEQGQQAEQNSEAPGLQAGSGTEEGNSVDASDGVSGSTDGRASADGSAGMSGSEKREGRGVRKGGAQQSSVSLLDLVMAGLSTDVDAALAVDACLALIHELDLVAESGQYQVLFAVDDFNALHEDVPTGYGVWQGADPELGGAGAAAAERRLSRRPLRVEELTLAGAISQLLRKQGPAHASVLCSVTSTSVRPKDMGAHSPKPRRKALPLYSMTEVANTLQHYYKCGALTHPPSRHLANRIWALTGGNAAQLRQLVPQISLLEGKRDHRVHLTSMEYLQLPVGAQKQHQML